MIQHYKTSQLLQFKKIITLSKKLHKRLEKSPASVMNMLIIQQVVCKVCVKGSSRRLFMKLQVASFILLKPLTISVVEAILNQSRFFGSVKQETVTQIVAARQTNCSHQTAKFRRGYKFSWLTVILCELGEANITIFGLASMMGII